MRFPGFGASGSRSVRLIGPLGKEHKVELVVRGDELHLCAKGQGQVLEALPLHALTWAYCALPGRDQHWQHCLYLQLAAASRPRELLLRAPSHDSVLGMTAMLDAASQQLAQRSLREELLRSLREELLRSQSLQQQDEEGDSEGEGEGEGEGEEGVGAQEGQAGGGWAGEKEGGTSPGAQSLSLRGSEGCSRGGSDDAEGGSGGSCAEEAEDAGGSPAAAAALLPPPAASPRPGHSPSAGAASPAAAAAAAPVLLLSYSSRARAARGACLQREAPPAPLAPTSGRVASHVEALEQMVCQLSQEVANSRGSTPRAKSARRGLLIDFLDSPTVTPSKQPTALPHSHGPFGPPPTSPRQPPSKAGAHLSPPCSLREPPLSERSPCSTTWGGQGPADAVAPDAAGGSRDADNSSSSASKGSCRQVATLLDENSALFTRASELHSELGAARAQLELAAADNVRLTREAADALRELQAIAGAAAAGREREKQLQASLGEAIERCEAIGRELAPLSGQLERRAAQCEELRRTVEELGKEKTVLTAALTTAQLQLREATPAGFAAQAAELRQQSTAAAAEAAAAREAAAAAEREAAAAGVRLAESQRREAEVASHVQEAATLMEEARATRQAGMARERQLSAEVDALRAQLGGRAPVGGAFQRQIEELSIERAGLSSQVAELHRVGEALSRSCASLEASLAQALQERDALRDVLACAKQAQQGAEAAWAAERASLERQLAGLSAALQGQEGSATSSKSQAQALQAQLEGLRQELSEARQRASAREQELQGELKLLAARAESEARGLRERLEAAAGAEREAAQGEVRRLQEEMRRLHDEYTVSSRGLQLEVSTLGADNARLAQEAAQAQSLTAALRGSLEAAQRDAQQAWAQLATAASAQVELAQESKELQRRLDRAGVERDRAGRERDALGLRYALLQQQYRLLEAVLGRQGRGRAGRNGKENGLQQQQAALYGVKAQSRQDAGAQGVLLASPSLFSASYSD